MLETGLYILVKKMFDPLVDFNEGEIYEVFQKSQFQNRNKNYYIIICSRALLIHDHNYFLEQFMLLSDYRELEIAKLEEV